MRKREELDVSDGEDPDTMTIMMTQMKMEHVFNLSPAPLSFKATPSLLIHICVILNNFILDQKILLLLISHN